MNIHESKTRSSDKASKPSAVRPKLLVFDFDGVLTDNKVLVFDNGTEAVICNRADGLGFDMLRNAGVRCVIISTEINPVVSRRCDKLRLECLQGIRDKRLALEEFCQRNRIALESVWYVGNDLNDLTAMQLAGCAICPADAHPAIRSMSHITLPVAGGNGVVRAIAEGLFGLQYGAATGSG
jgi:YrbI family 3-deoxy-D-manno-octulosonate 8-phosphate phosphatase